MECHEHSADLDKGHDKSEAILLPNFQGIGGAVSYLVGTLTGDAYAFVSRFEALLLVKLMCWTGATAFHLPPIFNTFLDSVSLNHHHDERRSSCRRARRMEYIPREICTNIQA